MSELSVGSLSGLAANSYVIDVASGSQLTQPGMVLQVVSTTKTDTFSGSLASNTPTPITGLSVGITPSSTNSKVLVSGRMSFTADRHSIALILKRDATAIGLGTGGSAQVTTSFVTNVDAAGGGFLAFEFLDSPATTSAITYSVDVVNLRTSTMTVTIGRSEPTSFVDSRSTSTITAIEVAG